MAEAKTKKELKWRLSDLPNGAEVAELVAQGVITKEEARKILFNEEKEDSNKLKARDEEIKFLRELVDKLASKHNGYTTIYHEYRRLSPTYPIWYSSYGPIMTTYSSASAQNAVQTYNVGTVTSGTISNNLMSLNSGTSTNSPYKGLSSLN